MTEQKYILMLKTTSPQQWIQTISIFLRISMILSFHPLLSQEKPAKQAVTLWKSKFRGHLSQQFHPQTKSWPPAYQQRQRRGSIKAIRLAEYHFNRKLLSTQSLGLADSFRNNRWNWRYPRPHRLPYRKPHFNNIRHSINSHMVFN